MLKSRCRGEIEARIQWCICEWRRTVRDEFRAGVLMAGRKVFRVWEAYWKCETR